MENDKKRLGGERFLQQFPPATLQRWKAREIRIFAKIVHLQVVFYHFPLKIIFPLTYFLFAALCASFVSDLQ